MTCKLPGGQIRTTRPGIRGRTGKSLDRARKRANGYFGTGSKRKGKDGGQEDKLGDTAGQSSTNIEEFPQRARFH